MGFQNENYWRDFINKIQRAEEDVEAGRVIPIEEVIEEMNQWMATIN